MPAVIETERREIKKRLNLRVTRVHRRADYNRVLCSGVERCRATVIPSVTNESAAYVSVDVQTNKTAFAFPSSGKCNVKN